MLLIGTRKGGFVALSDADRKSWTVRGPAHKGVEVNHMHYADGVIHAVGKSAWWGPGLQMSRDLGGTWVEPKEQIRFADGRDLAVERIWIVAGGGNAPLYAGLDPGALFRSSDGGDTWEEVRGLTDHPTREKWFPGNGGLMVHSMCIDPTNPARMFVGISAAGVFRTDDGGESWSPKNTGVNADFLPEKDPEVGHCVHHMEMHTSDPTTLYQQNHCGVYRSDDSGDSWTDISEGLPSRFGFPIAVHPHDGDTIYVVPLEGDVNRVTMDGKFRVYRSRDRGRSWQALTKGLPQEHAYQNVMRSAMAVDQLDEPGVYVGTQGGHVVASFDEGDSWSTPFSWLPPIYSLEAHEID